MKTKGTVLEPRYYLVGALTPPLVLEDKSRFNNDGAFAGGMTWTQLPSGLWVLACNGSSSYIWVGGNPSPESLKLTEAATIEMWLWISSNSAGTDYACAKNNSLIDLEYQHPGNLYGRVWASISGVKYLQADAFVNDVWQHHCVTYDKNAGASNCRYYLNGEYIKGDTGTGDLTTSTSPFALGANHNGALNLLGFIGIPHIYAFALDPIAIDRHFVAQRDWFGV
jgi:hypothetical protein